MDEPLPRTIAPVRLCALLEIVYPIVQAPIGSASCPALAAAVSNAGGLGTLAMTWRSTDEVRAAIRETRALTDKPFGVNLVLASNQDERMAACIDEGAEIYSFFWGDAARHLRQARDAGAIAIVSVGSIGEARHAVDKGASAIVAQGIEAGGHVRGEVGTMALTLAVADAVAPVPVLASGGIGDGRGIAAALALGAAGVWLGTRFLATPESNVHPAYRDAILAAAAQDTVHGVVFDGGWPDAPHRAIRNRTVEMWERAGRPLRGARPDEHAVVGRAPDGTPLYRYGDDIPITGTTGDVSELAMYAGQSVSVIDDVVPAGVLVRRLWHDAMSVANALAGSPWEHEHPRRF